MEDGVIAVGMMVAMIILASAWAKRIMSPVPRASRHAPREVIVQQVGSVDRQKALAVYENLCREKLDVMKTALAMGWSQDDLTRLDARLEKLIGQDQLQQLARGEVPQATADLSSLNITRETALLKEIRANG